MTVQPDEKPDETTEQPNPEEPVQPAEHPDAPATSNVIELHTERGSLTLRPNQTELDANQKAALVAIGIDPVADPQVIPQIRPFMHMCQVKGLDPWAREAYLIGRGQGNNRKYTMQTGIDGYRKIANATGRFIRVKEVLWTGQDDDDRTWIPVPDDKGGVVMRRVWYDQWPASKGYPGAAKVTIEHYDVAGNVVETEGVADWGMYAPFTDEWSWHPTERGKKVYKTDPETGERVRTLNDMWSKGYAHMLAKCAEALACRKAFPASMSGVYTHEEMHRADQVERDRLAAEQRAARTRAYVEATGRKAVAPAAGAAAEETSAPIPVGDVVPEVIEQIGDPEGASHGPAEAGQQAPEAGQQAPEAGQQAADPVQRAAWLRAELEYQAGVLDHSVSKLAARPMRALRKNVEEVTDAELLPLVAGLRPAVVSRLREDNGEAEAEAYAALGPSDVVDVAEYLAVDAEVEPEPEGDPAEDPRLDASPEEPHEPVLVGGLCEVCGEEGDYVLHVGAEDTPGD